VARPWPKRALWPRRGKRGRKSYTVGFYDHDKRERCRTFPSVRHARAWMDDYISAERRGRDSLRRFLLDLDAKEANERETRSIGEMLELYLQVNAHPRNEGGLAPTTYERYEETINRHLLGKPYAMAVAVMPAVSFNGPQAPRAWREQMLREGASKATRERAWRVLSAALSWAAASHLVSEIEINGCTLATEPRGNKRRSLRSGGTGYAPAPRRHGPAVPSWALSPQAVEAIRAQLLQHVKARHRILARRDAMIVSLQYGLGARKQEVWALRWSSLAGEYAWVTEVLSCGRLDEWGKTEHSTSDAPPSQTSCARTSPRGGRPWNTPGMTLANGTSSSLATSPARSTACTTPAPAPATSAKARRAPGARDSSPRRSSGPHDAPSCSPSSAPRPTRCAAAASPCACAPRTHRPSPASAERA
jgi:integrase